MRKSIRKEERMDNEQVKRAREKARYNVCCYNCEKRDTQRVSVEISKNVLIVKDLTT